MGNAAVSTNYPYEEQAPIALTTHGSDWLWAVFAIMLVSDIAVFAWHFTLPRGQRIFHQLSLVILTTASIAYFAMASDLGSTSVPVEFSHYQNATTGPNGTGRQIWYTRYIDWVITTPSLLLTLVLASGLPLGDIVTLIFFDIVMIVTGLVGALVGSSYKWGFYVFGNVALFYIWWVLAGPARTSAAAIAPEFKKTFTIGAGILSFLWLLYPVAWGLADGGNVISTDGEMVFYGVLDVLAKPVFCFIHLGTLSRLDLTQLQLTSGKFTSTLGSVGAYDAEKARHPRTVNNGGLVAHDNTFASTGAPGAAAGTKKGLFAKRGKYDAAAPATAAGTTEPRMSEATATSRA